MVLNLIFGHLISDFLPEILKANKKWQKGSLILHFSFAQKASLLFDEPQQTQYCKKYTPATPSKTQSLYNNFLKVAC